MNKKNEINKKDALPYFLQLKEILDNKIANGDYPDKRMESEYKIAEKYKITTATVRKALSELEKEDKIYRVKGLGTFIKERIFDLDIAKYISLGMEIDEKGIPEEIKVLSKKVIDFDEKIFNDYKVYNVSKKILNIERVRYIQNEPLVLEKVFFNDDLLHSVIEVASERLVYNYIVKNLKISIGDYSEFIEPICLNLEESGILKVRKGFPALLIVKVIYDYRENWIVFGKTIIRGDRCRFRIK